MLLFIFWCFNLSLIFKKTFKINSSVSVYFDERLKSNTNSAFAEPNYKNMFIVKIALQISSTNFDRLNFVLILKPLHGF